MHGTIGKRLETEFFPENLVSSDEKPGLPASKGEKMSITARRFLAAALVFSLLIQMHIAENGYASRGTKIAFASTRDGNYEIYVMDGDGKNQRRVTVHPNIDHYPTWSPDGKKIAFVSNRNGGRIQIWVIDADGKNTIRLTDGVSDQHPDWSPDGTKIAYDFLLNPWDNDNWKRTIYVIDSDGTNNRQLIKKPDPETDPSWSPDGRKIAFRSHSHERPDEIYVMDADGGDIERITHGGASKAMPAWSPDGSRIAYCTNAHIWVMDSDGKNQRLITGNGRHRHPTWSPDSETIAFQSHVEHSFSIFTVDAEDGGMDTLLQVQDQDDSNPDWFHPGGLSVTPAASRITIWGRLKKVASSLR